MIGASGNVNSLVSGELVARSPLREGGERPAREEEANQAAGRGDSVSLSAEAIALARNVPPAGEASETGGEERREARSAGNGGGRSGGIDILA
ncbi:MAG: hypothetical protein F9K32_05570 [Desulfobulbaceae bacterium]|nr:MAG: hypothetical protein F9K32_05570 [Desulfobulbaceae bacterium]